MHYGGYPGGRRTPVGGGRAGTLSGGGQADTPMGEGGYGESLIGEAEAGKELYSYEYSTNKSHSQGTSGQGVYSYLELSPLVSDIYTHTYVSCNSHSPTDTSASLGESSPL